jgi:beta-galactosidase
VIRTPFNDAWSVGPVVSVHEAIVVAGPGEQQVSLPHDAMLSAGRAADHSGGPQTGYFRDGKWTYEKQFDVPQTWATKRVTFEFEGVYRDAMIYLNGALAGQWANGYSTFYVNADPYLNYGETNTIRVDAQAHQDSRWYSGGGLHRPVHLLVGELVHITPTGLRVTTPDIDPDLATVVASTEIVNEDIAIRSVDIELEIRDTEGTLVASDTSRVTLLAGDRATAHQRTYVQQPALWSVDSPSLYQATVRLTGDRGQVDEASTTFGIRRVTVDPVRGLRINGETVKLRGAAVHHDNGILGAADFADASERRVRLLKAAGFNALRSAHNPMSASMLEACDRHGMLVMDEAFDVWTVAKSGDDYSRRFPQWWERDIDAMVAKDFNHPSVIMYSIGNEIIEAGTPHGTRRGRRLADRVRTQDPTRLVTHALQGMYIARDQISALKAQTQQDAEIRGLNDYLGQLTHLIDSLMASPIVGERLAEPPRCSTSSDSTTAKAATSSTRKPSPTALSSARRPSRRESTTCGGSSPRTHTSSATSPGRAGTSSAKSAPAGTSTPKTNRSIAPPTHGSPPPAETSTSPVAASPSPTTARSSTACAAPPTSPYDDPATTDT